MKQIMLTVVLVILCSSLSFAANAVTGEGDELRFDRGDISAEMQATYDLLAVKCASCHSEARTVQAVNDGKSPISGAAFDKPAAKAYGVKMMRKPDSGINKSEAKELIGLLYYLIDKSGN